MTGVWGCIIIIGGHFLIFTAPITENYGADNKLVKRE